MTSNYMTVKWQNRFAFHKRARNDCNTLVKQITSAFLFSYKLLFDEINPDARLNGSFVYIYIHDERLP